MSKQSISFNHYDIDSLVSQQLISFNLRIDCKALTMNTRIYVTHPFVHSPAITSSAFFLLICGYFGNSIPVVITLLAVSVGIGGFVAGGSSVNHLDIGASYAGILMGITNMCGTLPGFIGPQVAKLIAATVRMCPY